MIIVIYYHRRLFKQFPWLSPKTLSWICNLQFADQWLSGPHLMWTVGRRLPGATRRESLQQHTGVEAGPQVHALRCSFLAQRQLCFSHFFFPLLENGGQTSGQKVDGKISKAENWLERASWWTVSRFGKQEAWTSGYGLLGNQELCPAKEPKLFCSWLLKKAWNMLT